MRKFCLVVPVIAISLLAASASSSAQDAAPTGFGLDIKNAVEVCRPQGQQQYLARLVCPDDSHPSFARAGSVGQRNEFPDNMSSEEARRIMFHAFEHAENDPNQPDYHMVDAYNVTCGKTQTVVYMDMYHCDAPIEQRAPAGFRIIN